MELLFDNYEIFFDLLFPMRFKYIAPSNQQDTYRMGFVA
jgi:hypothetical protein